MQNADRPGMTHLCVTRLTTPLHTSVRILCHGGGGLSVTTHNTCGRVSGYLAHPPILGDRRRASFPYPTITTATTYSIGPSTPCLLSLFSVRAWVAAHTQQHAHLSAPYRPRAAHSAETASSRPPPQPRRLGAFRANTQDLCACPARLGNKPVHNQQALFSVCQMCQGSGSRHVPVR
jgi:hypothetical protein